MRKRTARPKKPKKRLRKKQAAKALARDRRKLQAVALRLEGLTQVEIAARLEVDQSQVSRYLGETREEWTEKRLDLIEQITVRELQQLEALRHELHQAFAAALGRGELLAAVGFAARILGCSDAVRKVTGINAPERHEHGGIGGGPLFPDVPKAKLTALAEAALGVLKEASRHEAR